MKQFLRSLLTFFMITASWSYALSQGCSDAGFCTMGAMKPDQPYNKKIDFRLRSMELTYYRASTSLTPMIYSITADMSFSLSAKTTFQVKVPYQAVKGSLGETAGVGDLSLCFTRNLRNTEKFDVNLTVGTKIPTNKSNLEENGLPLPMYYQTSLGTYDFITGISFINRNWLFATGIQHPLTRNNNDFLWKRWANSGHSEDYIEKYAPAKDLKRGTDVMLRAERNFRFSRVNFSIGLLPIYRITNDEFLNDEGKTIKPDKAKGLALSGLLTAGYQFNVRTGLRFLAGHKIIQREKNPDGLSREFITTISYFYRF